MPPPTIRVPIRIYRLYEAPPLPGMEKTSSVVQNKTEDDCVKILNDPKRYVSISPEDVTFDPNVTLSVQMFEVQEDTSGRLYIEIGPRVYYIQRTNRLGNLTFSGTSKDVFEFYVKPERISPTWKKIVSEIRVRRAWEIQHWGEQLTELRVEGRSGALLSKDAHGVVLPVQDQDVTQSPAWQRLMELKTFYDEDHQLSDDQSTLKLLGMNYYDQFFIGYFTDFSGPNADSEHPYIVNYAFTFKVQKAYPASIANKVVGTV